MPVNLDLVKIVPLLLVCSIALSAHAQDPRTFANNLRAGESINGFPNWAERVILEWMNRARVDPQKELATCGSACAEAACYKPSAPLVWNEALNHSARFHSDEMAKQHFFAHDSKCQLVRNIAALYPVACDGSESCSCTEGLPTAWTTRVAMFGNGPSGEIIAGASEPNAAFYLWLYEPSASPSCGFGTGNGHRYLILGPGSAVGVGVTGNAVGDFGGGDPPYKIPSAAHYPKQADSVALWANWYDSAAPKSANAVVDGKCSSMSLQRGTPQNGAWSATATGVGSGCHRYYFSFIDSTGAEVTYPATGSLGIGGASCDDWNSTRLTAKCGTSSTPPPPPPPQTTKRRAVKRH
ncbi:MAG TPA: CAP domain-containing protein [Thermoanaerobaculia bacterium]|nr:CAP domain-containing protein [Thermoanaerobaculia bacterium]